MFRVAIVFAVCLIAVLAEYPGDEAFEKCRKLFKRDVKHCCQIPKLPKPADKEAIKKECASLPGIPESCERDLCFATKRGYITDGKMDPAKATEITNRVLEASPEIAAAIKEKCINGDVSSYGPSDLCDVSKFNYCRHLQMITRCPKWDNTGSCEGLEAVATECGKIFS